MKINLRKPTMCVTADNNCSNHALLEFNIQTTPSCDFIFHTCLTFQTSREKKATQQLPKALNFIQQAHFNPKTFSTDRLVIQSSGKKFTKSLSEFLYLHEWT